MINLLQETLNALSLRKLSPEDVQWVGASDGSACTSWKEFAELADREYDNGYGGAAIPEDLVVVGKDWWLERQEYDGSEWWAFQTKPIQKKNAAKIKSQHIWEGKRYRELWCDNQLITNRVGFDLGKIDSLGKKIPEGLSPELGGQP